MTDRERVRIAGLADKLWAEGLWEANLIKLEGDKLVLPLVKPVYFKGLLFTPDGSLVCCWDREVMERFELRAPPVHKEVAYRWTVALQDPEDERFLKCTPIERDIVVVGKKVWCTNLMLKFVNFIYPICRPNRPAWWSLIEEEEGR